MTVDGYTFEGDSGVSSISAFSNDIVDSINKHLEEEIIPAAIHDMKTNIIHCAEGYEVKRQKDKLFEEEKKMRTAEWLRRKFIG